MSGPTGSGRLKGLEGVPGPVVESFKTEHPNDFSEATVRARQDDVA